MNIQSLSIVVPNKKCINDCQFCVSKMHTEDYPNHIDDLSGEFLHYYEEEFIKRLNFARDNNCNTIMLTGNSEVQQNRSFLNKFATFNNSLDKPFRWIEMQTTGVLLDRNYLSFLRNKVGVSTISLSLSSFDNDMNAEMNGTPESLKFDILKLCREIKEFGFNLRLSLNLTKDFIYSVPTKKKEYLPPHTLFEKCKMFGADQVTLRVLYTSDKDTPQDEWIRLFGMNSDYVEFLKNHIKENGRPLEVLPFGAIKYDYEGLSVVIDDDCMSNEVKEDYKYLILQPDCKLYSKWDTKASLIF